MDPYEEVGSILTNLTREKAARQALLDQSCPFLSSLPAQLTSSSLARRQGFAATLKNIALKAEVGRPVLILASSKVFKIRNTANRSSDAGIQLDLLARLLQ